MTSFRMTPLGSDLATTINGEMLFIDIGDNLQLVIDPTTEPLQIRVYPITEGEIWDSPFAEFNIDGEEIKKLETQMKE